MKSFLVVSILVLVTLAAGVPHDRGCLYILGRCDHECPEGTHSYSPSPSKPWHYEPTCEVPVPEEQTSLIADYSDCYCDPPTVRDTVNDKCVTLDNCPKKE